MKHTFSATRATDLADARAAWRKAAAAVERDR